MRRAPDIAACLAAKRHLKRLNLTKNDLKDEGCVVIVHSMEVSELKYVDVSYNGLRREGAVGLAHVVVKKEGFKILNIDGNMISHKGVEEVREIFKNYPKLLGPLDDNDPDGVSECAEEKKDNVDDDKKLESEMKILEDDEFVRNLLTEIWELRSDCFTI